MSEESINLVSTNEAPSWALHAEGLPFAWALLLLILAGFLIVWSHQKFAFSAGKLRSWILMILRFLLVGVLLWLVTRPVLERTSSQNVRSTLLVLVDSSASMSLTDERKPNPDQIRAAIALNLVDPKTSLEQKAPNNEAVQKTTRAQMVQAVFENPRLDLLGRLSRDFDLVFYGFDRQPFLLTSATEEKEKVATSAKLPWPPFDGDATAIGDAVIGLLNNHRGQPLAGILLATDGVNNTGSPPTEAVQQARVDGVPLFTYGVGIETPRDFIMQRLQAPRLGFVNERVNFEAAFRATGMVGSDAKVVLLQNGKEVARTSVRIETDGIYEATLAFEPDKAGASEMEVRIEPDPNEFFTDNNRLSTPLRVIDDKIRVLYIEETPRWDFRYLLSALQLDKRLDVSAFLFNGDPGLDQIEDSPFLKELPRSPEELIRYQIIILGDVNPESLGEEWMRWMEKWVNEVGGGVIFLAGTQHNPIRYAGTPLEPLLPVLLDRSVSLEVYQKRYPELQPLRLTPEGEVSPYLRLSDQPQENLQIWRRFPGVRWTAKVGRAKPGAEVSLVDPDPSRSAAPPGMPVIARHTFGAGEVVYFGIDETYRWRSKVGNRHYIRIWGQIMQAMSLQRLQGASDRVQLRASRPRYSTGEQVVISGRIFQKGFTPMTQPTIPGVLVRLPLEGGEQEIDRRELNVEAQENRLGEYAASFTVTAPGRYRFHTLEEPTAIVEFDVQESRIELKESGLNITLLTTMAKDTKGQFFREESLHQLPGALQNSSTRMSQLRSERLRLYYSPWWLLALVVLMCSEWTLRRLSGLK